MNKAHCFLRVALTFALALSGAVAYGRGGQKPSSPKNGPKDGASAAKPAAGKTVNVNFKDVKLKNGLRVLLVEDHSAPVVSVAITFDVGSRNERAGRTGFAHLFGHMMFPGSENGGRNEYWIWMDPNSAWNNVRRR